MKILALNVGGTSGGAASNSFSIIQPDSGTSPSAASATDTLTLTSSNSTLGIVGNSATKTIDFSLAAFNPTTMRAEFFDDHALQVAGSHVGVFDFAYQGTATLDVPLAGEKNRYGIVKIPVASATSGGFFGDLHPIILGGATITWAEAVYLTTTPNGTDDYLARFGIGDVYSGVTNGCWFTVDRVRSTTNWIAVTAKASVATYTDTGVAFTAATWVNLRIEVDAAAASAKFYMDGVLVATNATNVPTATGSSPFAYVLSVLSVATKTVRIDWTLFRFTPSSARGVF